MDRSPSFNPASASVAWPLALAACTIVGTLVTACMMPFIAIAVMAAATLPVRSAVATVALAWGANQLLGFTALGYPLEAYAMGWGVALLVAAAAAAVAAHALLRDRGVSLLSLGAAFALAFVLDEALLFGYATVAGGTATFTPAIIGQILLNESIWCIVLALCHVALTRLAPRVFGAAPALRFA